MMLIPLSSPIGPFPSEWHTRLKPPANHSQVSVARYLPPGPYGLGFSSASEVHLPTKYASFLCSGPGCGGPAGACAITAATPHNVKMRTPTLAACFTMCGLLIWNIYLPLFATRTSPYPTPPAQAPRMTRGQDGSLCLSCAPLTFTTPRRFIPAHPTVPKTDVADPIAPKLVNCTPRRTAGRGTEQ